MPRPSPPPPSPPPSPPAPPSFPPSAPLPPLLPSSTLVESVEQLRSLVATATAGTTLLLQLQRNVHFSLGGEELECTEDATLSIRSSPDASATLDAGELSRHFLVSNGCHLTLEGDITLVNGRAARGEGEQPATPSSRSHGGSLLISGATAVLRGVTIRNSFADGDGGGIASRDGSRLDLKGVTVSGCEAGRSGGGLFAEQSERLQISDSVFERNKADKGGAAIEYASENADSVGATIVATSFKGNVGKTTVSAKARITWICERGQYMPRTSGDGAEAFTGDLKCFDCAAGFFGNETDLSSPTCSGQCPEGNFCEQGTADPTPCPAGTRMPARGAASSDSCIPCAPGQFQLGTGATECYPCRPGSYSSSVGEASCEPCPPGGYCEVEGAATSMVWEPCPAGSFSPTSGSDSSASCELCPAGTASAAPGAVSHKTCEPCEPGHFAATPGLSKCERCEPGTTSGVGSSACSECAAGTYAANPGQGQCVPCPYPLSGERGAVTCSVCQKDFYLLKSADPAEIFSSPTDYCKPCPPNAECSDDTSLATLGVPAGYWRASPSSAVLTACRDFGGDRAGEARCAGNERGAKQASRRLEAAGSDEYCASDFTGPECELCAAENQYLVDGDECKECGARGAAAGRIAGLVLGLCVACGLAAWAYSMTDWREKRFIGPILRFADRSVKYYVGGGMTAKVKILFGFYQISTVLSSTYSARLPDKYTGWTDTLASAISIDWSGFFLPEQCLGYGMRLVVSALSPVVLIALLMGTGIALRLRRWRAASPRPTLWAEAALGLLDLTPAGLVLIFCFVPSISASIFRSWSCQAYTISPPNEPLEQVSYMRQDASVECYTEDHESITDLAVGFIVLWPVGSLVLFTSLLAACYKPLQAKSPNALTRATAFLHREYEKTWYWWEAVELARKLVLTGFVLLIPEKNAFLRLVVATLICSCYAVVLAVVRPYKRVEDDVLAVATSLVLLLLFLGTNWTTIFLGIEERYQGADPADVLGFGKLNAIVDTMIVLVAVALVFFLIGAVVAARRVAEVPTIRLVSTKQPPDMSIGTGLTWHLFLSHIWSTGQDAVGNIKSELQLLVPGLKIFLDVDDLKDIGSLEEYIQHSQVILFFLSCGYFRSKNCLREIRSSLEQSKPIVLVQEADPAKGGATLQALRGECPEDLQPDIFEKGWAHTIYMRVVEFQRVSLKTIVEAVLLCSPNYLNQTSLPLCVPGEPESQLLAFAKETMLWASPANAGALELANKIAAAFAGLTISTADARPATATHMLLYLNEDSFSDARLAEQVKQARKDKLKIVMAHENDPDLGGCAFGRMFEVTPQELIADGLYKTLARSCFPGCHHPVSLALLAKDLGATPARSGSVARMSRLSGSIAKRGSRLVPAISRRSSAKTTTAGDGSGGEATVSVVSEESAVSVQAAQEHV